MTELTIKVEDQSILPHLKKILNAIEGVSIVKTPPRHPKNGIEEALDDVKAGRVTRYENAQELFKAFGI